MDTKLLTLSGSGHSNICLILLLTIPLSVGALESKPASPQQRPVTREVVAKVESSPSSPAPIFLGDECHPYEYKAPSGLKKFKFEGGRGKWKQPPPTDDNKTQDGIPLSPVILIPGYGGSRMLVKGNEKFEKRYSCVKESYWTNIWINLTLMLPHTIQCLVDVFKLKFDWHTNTTMNTDGVDIRVRDPDDVASLEFLSDIQLPHFMYFGPMIWRLMARLGYMRNYNIKGAPYDFRKAPNELQDYFAKLKRDSESLYSQFRGRRLTYICHSMGCNNILYFLQRQSQEWKDKHVLRVITLAAPWGGSMKAIRATVVGNNLGLPQLFDEAIFRTLQKSLPSTMYLYPKERVFQNSSLIRFKPQGRLDRSEIFRANDFGSFFEKIKYPNGYQMWLNTKDLLGSLEAPQVEIWCLYGEGSRTLGSMEFRGDFPNSAFQEIQHDGDGTVTVQSSTYCRQWAREQEKYVYDRSFNVNHMDMVRDKQVLEVIEAIMTFSND